MLIVLCSPEGQPMAFLCPHSLRDLLLFGADGVGVDRGCGEPGMSEPFLRHVQGNFGDDGLDAEAVPAAFGSCAESPDRGGVHDFPYAMPSCCPRPIPQTRVTQ